MTAPASLSQVKFARLVGLSRSRVGALVQEGKLPCLADRSIPMPAGLDALRLHRGAGADERIAEARRRAEDGAAPLPAEARPPGDNAEEVALAREHRRAQTAKATTAAALAELEIARRRGELVPLSEVEAEAREVAGAIRERLLSLPSRVALAIEGLAARTEGPPRSAAIEAVILDEVNVALRELSGSRFAGGGDDAAEASA